MARARDGGRQRVVIVTGASSGIGRATARALARDDWTVVLAARSAQSLARVERQCRADGAEALTVVTDVGNAEQVRVLFDAAILRFGRVDAVVNAVAAVAYGHFSDVPAEIFDRAITTNLLGTANVARAALAHFRESGGGHLVVIGSLLGKIAVPFMSSYVTGKWGVHGLARILQIEARQIPGVHVSLISPGSVNTPAYSQAANYVGREGRPPPPVDSPEKVARAIVRTMASPTRERSVGIANPLVVLGFRALPAVFDALVSPLMSIGGLSRDRVPPNPGNVLDPLPDGDAEFGKWGRQWLRPAAAAGAAVAVAGAAALGREHLRAAAHHVFG